MYKRREFLELMALTAAAGALGGCRSLSTVAAKTEAPASVPVPTEAKTSPPPFEPLKSTAADEFVFAEGFHFDTVARAGEILNVKSETFGSQSTGACFMPFHGRAYEGLLWVSHGEVIPSQVTGYKHGSRSRQRDQIEREMQEVGGSIVHVRFQDGNWKQVMNSSYNRRLTADTPIPFVSQKPVSDGQIAMGTVGNACARSTPWKTILVCEKNYMDFFGEARFSGKKRSVHHVSSQDLRWSDYFPRPPEHYGWILEVDPRTGRAKKLTAPGRFAHSGVALRTTPEGRGILYMSESSPGGFFYKFVADQPNSLATGRLFAADFAKGTWLELSHETNPKLGKAFTDSMDLLIRTSEAAKMAGATKLSGPSGVVVDPESSAVFLSVQSFHGNDSGAILRIVESDKNVIASNQFTHSIYFEGDKETFVRPSFLHLDLRGHLWALTAPGANHRNSKVNSGIFCLRNGQEKMECLKVGSAPASVDLAGLTFAPDGRALFLTVRKRDSDQPSTAIAVSGPSLEALSAAIKPS